MKLYIDDKILSIIYEKDYEEKIIRKNFTFKDSSNAFNKGSFDAKKIKTICFVKKKKQYNFLYSGFLQDLLLICKNNNIAITSVKDERTKLDYQKKEWNTEQLSAFFPNFAYVGHQIKSLHSMLKTNIGIIEAPTSSGKSEIFIAFIKATRYPTLIVVNRITLARQLVRRIKDNGFNNIGLCTGSGVSDGDIIVSTIGSVKKIPNLSKYKILMLDEVHRAQANTYQDFLSKISYPMRFGFSATPNCGDKYKYALIRQFMGNVICKIEVAEVLEEGVIALPKIEMVKVDCFPTLDWPSAHYKCIVHNKDRNDKIKKLVLDHNLPTLILVHHIAHGTSLMEDIPGSIFVSGVDDVNKRDRIIEDFENGKIKTVISTNIFNEGISINAIRLLIIAGGGKSKIETVQRLGRGLRLDPKTGKKDCFVFDFCDKGNLFTERHSEMREKIYKKAGFEVGYSSVKITSNETKRNT